MTRGINDEKSADGFVVATDAHCSSQSERALYVDIYTTEHDFIPKKVIVPKAHVHPDSEVYDPEGRGKLIVTTWLARERGWLDGEDNSDRMKPKTFFGAPLPPVPPTAPRKK